MSKTLSGIEMVLLAAAASHVFDEEQARHADYLIDYGEFSRQDEQECETCTACSELLDAYDMAWTDNGGLRPMTQEEIDERAYIEQHFAQSA